MRPTTNSKIVSCLFFLCELNIFLLYFLQLFDHCLAPTTEGDGTGCDNMTAVIAKLKPGAFKNSTTTEGDAKTVVTKTECSVETKKRPNEEESTAEPEIQQPEAKKAKTENTSEAEVKKEVSKPEGES